MEASLPNCAWAKGQSGITLVFERRAHATSASSNARPTPCPAMDDATSVWSTMTRDSLARLYVIVASCSPVALAMKKAPFEPDS